MPIRQTVFGSPREGRLFKALRIRWGADFNLYPSLPFLSLMDVQDLPLSVDALRFLKTTTVDYTLCDKDDRPLVSIEFDGLTAGHSRDGTFVPRRRGADPLREKKLDLKLEVAELNLYPFVVVSNPEAAPLSKQTALTLVDGIIGQTLANRRVQEGIAELNSTITEEQLVDMSATERQEYIEDQVWGIEIEAELTHDPIAREAADLQRRLEGTGMYAGGSGQRFLEDSSVPPLPADFSHFTEPMYADLLRARGAAFNVAYRHGSEATIVTKVGTFTARA